MARTVTIKDKLTITLPSRLKRRITDVATDKGISRNDLIIHALNDYLSRADGDYKNADLLSDRMTQVLNSQMSIIHQLNQLNAKLSPLDSNDY